jgi:hypothetical protein
MHAHGSCLGLGKFVGDWLMRMRANDHTLFITRMLSLESFDLLFATASLTQQITRSGEGMFCIPNKHTQPELSDRCSPVATSDLCERWLK